MELEEYLNAEGIPKNLTIEEMLEKRTAAGVFFKKSSYEETMDILSEHDLVADCWATYRNEILEVWPIIIDNIKDGKKVLDIGCSDGLATVYYATYFPEKKFLGIDISAKALDLARQKAEKYNCKNVEFKKLNLLDLPKLNEKFDSVIATNMLEEVHTAEHISAFLVLDSISFIVEPNGIVLPSQRYRHSKINRDIMNAIQNSYNEYAEVVGLKHTNTIETKPYEKENTQMCSEIFEYIKS